MILNLLSVVIIFAVSILPFPSSLSSSPQSSPKYQSATVLEITEHPGGEIPATETTPPIKRYDVSVQVKDTVYVVLFTPRPGTTGFQTIAGTDMLVLVKEKTIVFNDLLGRTTEVPIISQHPATPRKQ